MVFSAAEIWWKCKEKATAKMDNLGEIRTDRNSQLYVGKKPEEVTTPPAAGGATGAQMAAEPGETQTAQTKQTPPARKKRRKEPDEEI
jgi:hypothetical protein